MKRLLLVRHAKSDWNNDLTDHERPLNMRGRKAAPFMGRKLAEKGLVPDLIISSTANRALTTARMMAEQLGYDESRIEQTSDVYHASAQELEEVVNRVGDEYALVMLVGHNPGMSMFVDHLTKDGTGHMPTAAIAGVSFGVSEWRAVAGETGMLLFFDYPKQYPEMQES